MRLEEHLNIIKFNTVDLLPEEELIEKLKAGRPLRIKYGADPSRPDLHLGHYVCLKKLKDLQNLGHHIIFIVGDFTAMIGDPSGRSKTRPRLSREEVQENSKTYFEQVFKVLDPEKTEIRYNSEWLSKLTSLEIIELSATYTVSRMLERDDFKERFKNNIPISIHEFLYPLFQAYDSVAIKADIEVGGTDQRFNFLVGREVQKAYGQEPQVILTVPILEGTDGKLKMSKSYDNYIGLTEPPSEMFGKVMSIPDELVLKYYRLVLYYDDAKMKEVEEKMKENPRDCKADLAEKIVEIFWGTSEAKRAREEFDRVFKLKEVPDEIPEYRIPQKGMPLIDILAQSGLVSSKSEARRLVAQRAVKIGNRVVESEFEIIVPDGDVVIKVGKRKFLRVLPLIQ
uniref:Tyrosine--tRNA ligase n=1 Tax=candidate division WOR-3 bacterium TaxID=2052148 RepID=A0A7V3ZY06_UNCW3